MNHTPHRADRKLAPDLEPRLELLPGRAIHPDLASLAALPASDEHSAATGVKIALLKGKRFADSQAGSPEQHDQRTDAMLLGAVADGPHHRDDLLDRRRAIVSYEQEPARIITALTNRKDPRRWKR